MWLSKNQKGIAGVFVAAIIGSGFFIALLGLVVDGGNMYLERRVHQSVADFSIQRLSKDCQTDYTAYCETEAKAIAHLNQSKALYPGNADTTIIEVCGPLIAKKSGGVPCDPIAESVTTCTPVPEVYSSSYIRVRTAKPGVGDGNEPYRVLNWFSSMSGGYSVGACAQAAWYGSGAATVSKALPFALSACRTQALGGDVLGDVPDNLIGVPVLIKHFVPSDSSTSPRIINCNVSTLLGETKNIEALNGFALVSLRDTTLCQPGGTIPIYLGGDPVIVDYSSNKRSDLCSRTLTTTDVNKTLSTVSFVITVGKPTTSGIGNYSFEVIGFTAFKLEGYFINNTLNGGKPPPGTTWASNGCSNNTPCLYGSFENAKTDLVQPLTSELLDTPNIGLISVLPLY